MPGGSRMPPSLLIRRQREPRLVLTGEKGWGKSIPAPNGGSHTVEMHELFDKEKIKHISERIMV